MPKENRLIPASSWPVFSFSFPLTSHLTSPLILSYNTCYPEFNGKQSIAVYTWDMHIISHKSVQIAASASYLIVAWSLLQMQSYNTHLIYLYWELSKLLISKYSHLSLAGVLCCDSVCIWIGNLSKAFYAFTNHKFIITPWSSYSNWWTTNPRDDWSWLSPCQPFTEALHCGVKEVLPEDKGISYTG